MTSAQASSPLDYFTRFPCGEMPTDAFVEDRLPRDEAEAEAIVAAQGFEQSKASAGEIGRAD
jgi:hypothetical protein